MGEASTGYLSKTLFSKVSISSEEFYRLSEKYGTPLFVMDETTLRGKLRELEDAYKDFRGLVRVAYSVKANFNPVVLRVFISEGILFDIASLGELFFYLRCGGDPENIIYTGVTETEKEYTEALKHNVRKIVVGSYNGLLNLIAAARSTSHNPDVMIRVNPEVPVKAEVKDHYRQGKFGAPFNTLSSDSAGPILKKILSSRELSFLGFHFHLGSQITDPTCFITAIEKLESFILKARREYGVFKFSLIDIGGGMPVVYGDGVNTPKEVGALVTKRLGEMMETLKSKFTLVVESGRYLSAEACVLVSRIINIKVYRDQKFVFVDAGYHLLLDAALLRQEYPQEVISDSGVEERFKVRLAGRLCDPDDVFPISSLSKLGGAEVGKLLLFRNTGAYSIVFNMPFHCQTKPPIIMRKLNGDYVLVRRGESIEDLFETEGGNIDINL